jgi:hypothetical protein
MGVKFGGGSSGRSAGGKGMALSRCAKRAREALTYRTDGMKAGRWGMHSRFLLLLPVLALTACGHLTRNYQPPAAANPSIAADPSKPNSPANTPDVIAANDIIAQIAYWRLGPVDIQNDLDGGVTIVRAHPPAAGAPTGRVDDAQLAADIKRRLETDPDVGHAKIDIAAKQGAVELRGRAGSAETIGRAIVIALGTPGVVRVSSDIKPEAVVAPAPTRP